MKAVQITQFGGPEAMKYRDLPDPTPGRGEALVQVQAAGVNFADVYARAGISEYWIVDPEARTIEVFVLQDGAYTLLVKAGPGEKAHSQLLNGFEVAVDEVFAG